MTEEFLTRLESKLPEGVEGRYEEHGPFRQEKANLYPGNLLYLLLRQVEQ